MTQPPVPTFDFGESSVSKLNQLSDAVRFTQAVDGIYTPSTPSGVTLGADGFIVGKWWRHSNHVTVIVDMLISGVGAVIGGASWRFSLPFNADLTFHTAGTLNATSDILGNYQTQSPTSADASTGAVLLSAVAELVLYRAGSTASLGSSNFSGASARVKATAHYVADPTAL